MDRESHHLRAAATGDTAIPLARVKTWNAGDTLTAADLNGEFNNVLNNPITLISPTTGAINFQTSVAHTNLVAAAISGTSGGGLPTGLSIVRGLLGATSSQSVTLSADQYLLQTTAANFPTMMTLGSTATFSVNVGTAGPIVNGRDVSAAFSSTFLHLYAITTGVGSTVSAGIASTSPPPTGPVLPTTAGYATWTYLCTLPYSSATTTLNPSTNIRGSLVTYTTEEIVLNAGAATTEATVSLSTAIPAVALVNLLSVKYNDNGAGHNTTKIRFVAGSDYKTIQDSVGSGGFQEVFLQIPNVSQQVFYINGQAGDATSIWVHGYTVPNGAG